MGSVVHGVPQGTPMQPNGGQLEPTSLAGLRQTKSRSVNNFSELLASGACATTSTRVYMTRDSLCSCTVRLNERNEQRLSGIINISHAFYGRTRIAHIRTGGHVEVLARRKSTTQSSRPHLIFNYRNFMYWYFAPVRRRGCPT